MTPKNYTGPFDEQRCRVCGCTWDTPCEGGCYWVEDDLCSACCDKDPKLERLKYQKWVTGSTRKLNGGKRGGHQ